MFQASIWTRSVVFVTYFVIYTETTYTAAIAVVKSIGAFCKKKNRLIVTFEVDFTITKKEKKKHFEIRSKWPIMKIQNDQ